MKHRSAIDFLRNFSSLIQNPDNPPLGRELFSKIDPCDEIISAYFGRAIAMYRATHMKPIMTAYPGYQALPKGLKRLLVESESFFFEEETTFFRKARKAAVSEDVAELQVAVTHTLSQSWDTGSDFEMVSE